MRTLAIEPRLDGLSINRLDEFKRTSIPGGKPRSRRQFVNSNFDVGLDFVLQPKAWEYLLRFERLVGEAEFMFHASYHSDKRELFTGCFTSPVALRSRQGSTIFASVSVSALPNEGFSPANDGAYLDAFEAHKDDVCRLEFETRGLT